MFDQDGRLHLARVAISKAGVSNYRGRDLLFAGADDVELDQVYRVLRPASALKAAVPTFRCVPILERHVRIATDTAAIQPADVIGALGSHVAFDGVYLTADACIWAQSAIDGIADGSKAAPSAGYEFSVRHEPGVFDGEPYSHKMYALAGHHVSLCERSRAGRDLRIPASYAIARRDTLPFAA